MHWQSHLLHANSAHPKAVPAKGQRYCPPHWADGEDAQTASPPTASPTKPHDNCAPPCNANCSTPRSASPYRDESDPQPAVTTTDFQPLHSIPTHSPSAPTYCHSRPRYYAQLVPPQPLQSHSESGPSHPIYRASAQVH